MHCEYGYCTNLARYRLTRRYCCTANIGTHTWKAKVEECLFITHPERSVEWFDSLFIYPDQVAELLSRTSRASLPGRSWPPDVTRMVQQDASLVSRLKWSHRGPVADVRFTTGAALVTDCTSDVETAVFGRLDKAP